MAAYGYMAKIGADTSGLQSALKDINSSLKSTDSELYKVNKSIKTAEQAGTDRADLLKQKEDVLGNAISETAQKLERLRSIEEQMKNAADNNSISAEQYRDYQRELGNTEAQLRQYQTQLAQTQQEQNNLSGSTQVVTASLTDIQNAAKKVGEDLSWFTDKLKAAADAALDYGEKMVKYSIIVGSAFESSMSTVKAYSGAAGDDFTVLENAAKEAGATTSKSAKDAADALGYMALAGWDTKEMLEGLMPIVRASEAGTADLKLTSDLVTDSMSAMGVATSDLSHYLDVCTAAQSNSNTTLTGLLEAYVGCGGTLRNLNVPLEESAALLGNLANRGIKASEAGTSLNSILVNLIGANKSASDAMDALGVSAWDEEGNFIGLSNTLKVLKGALENCTDQQKAFFEAKIGGKTQMDTLQALISGVSDEYDELYNTLVNSNGALETTAKTMQDNLAGAMTTMKSALEALGVEFYDYLEEPAKEAVNAVTEALRSLTEAVDKGQLGERLKELSEKAGDLIEKFVEFAAKKGLPMVIDGLSELVDLLSWAADHVDTLTVAAAGLGAAFLTIKLTPLITDLGTLITTIGSTVTAMAEAETASAALSIAMSAIPAVAVATAVIALGTAIGTYIVSVNEAEARTAEMRNTMDKAGESLTDAVVAFNETQKSIEKMTGEAENSIAVADRAIDSLDDLVDENGNLKNAQYNVDEQLKILNETFGLHLEVVNGQIQGYKDLKLSYEDFCDSLRKNAKLEAMRPAYMNAVMRLEELPGEIEDYQREKRNNDLWISDGRYKTLADATRTDIVNSDEYQVWASDNLTSREKKQSKNALNDDDILLRYLQWKSDVIQKQIDEATGEQEIHKQTVEDYQKLAYGQDSWDNAPKNDGYNSPSAMAAKESADKNNEASKKKADEKAAEEHSQLADVISQLENTDNDYSFGKITSEEDYYAQLESITESNKSLFEKYPDSDEFKVFKRYLDKVKSYKDRQNKANNTSGGKQSGSGSKETDPERIASQAISSKKTELENKKANDDNYTDADYYNDLEKWAETEVDHSTEAYIKLNTEIANGRKKLLENAEKKEQTAAKENAKSKADDIKSKAEEANNYDTSSLEYWQTLEEEYNKKDWTELEKGTDSYINLGNEIKKGKKKAEVSEAEKSFKNTIDNEKKRLERLVEDGSMTKAEMWAALADFYNDDDNFTEAERNTKVYKDYAETISEEKDDAEWEQKQSDKKEAEKNFKDEYDDLADKRKDNLISEEEYQKELLALKEKYAEYDIDISEHIAEKEKEINEKRIEDAKKAGEKQLEDIQKKYDDLDKKIDSRASELTKGSLDSGKLYEEKTLANGGGKKKVFTDLSKKKAEIEKYTKDLETLRKTDIPQDLMNEILAMDYDERKDVISELLKMSESSRNLYYSDYTEWHKAAQKAAELEYSDEKTALDEELKNSADAALADTVDIAGTYGEDAAKAYIDSWNKVLQEQGFSVLKTPQVKPQENSMTNEEIDKYVSGDNLTAADAHSVHRQSGDYIMVAPSTPVTINIAGEKVITKKIVEFLGINRISDGNNVNV